MLITGKFDKNKPAISQEEIATWLIEVTRTCAAKKLWPSCSYVANALALIFMNRRTGRCFPSMETVSEQIGVPLSSVEKAIKQLKSAGLLTTKRLGRNGPNSYQFTIHGTAVHEGPTDTHGTAVYGGCGTAVYGGREPLKGTSEEKDSVVPIIPPDGSPAAAFGSSHLFSKDTHYPATVDARERAKGLDGFGKERIGK